LDRDESVGALKPFRDLARGLALRGIAVLRYEKRTRQHALLCAHLRDFTVQDETVDDALRGIEFLRSDMRIGDRVAVLGHSLGGMLAPRIAREAGSLAGVVIMAGPARPLPQVVLEQVQYLATVSVYVTRSVVTVVQRQALAAMNRTSLSDDSSSPLLGVPISYLRDLDDYDPLLTARQLNVPTLILHGDRDYQVTAKDLTAWQMGLSGLQHVTVRTYPGLNHFFVAGTGRSSPSEYARPGRVAPNVIHDIADWITGLARD
jgi:dienelactone hydrolase